MDKKKLDQVFLYITHKCNSNCITCYMKEFSRSNKNMQANQAKNLLEKFNSKGAERLTLLGGEPTLHEELDKIIKIAKKAGYIYIRIQTNGQFSSSLFEKTLFLENVDTFSFSIDGANEKIHRKIRSGCSLKKTTSNMKNGRRKGYDIRANVTVTSLNVDQTLDILELARDSGATKIYFNIVFPMGGASQNKGINVSPKNWNRWYKKIRKKSENLEVKVKLPFGYSNKEPDQHQCLALKRSRVYVLPNGDAFPCILFLDKPELRLNGLQKGDYAKKLTGYLNIKERKINKYCHFLPREKKGMKPLCLYHRKTFGGR